MLHWQLYWGKIQKAVVNNVIDDELAEHLIIDESKPGNNSQERYPPPGRPIYNTINTPTMNLSRWVDIQLQPLVKKLPSYLQDDNHFLRKVNEFSK